MAIKESQFDPAQFPLDGTEKISILQGNPLDNKLLNVSDLFQYKINDLGDVAGGVTIDFSQGAISSITLVDDVQLTWSENSYPLTGYIRKYYLRIYQDNTGNRTVTWPVNTNGLWPNGSYTVTQTANALDIIEIQIDEIGNWIAIPFSNFYSTLSPTPTPSVTPPVTPTPTVSPTISVTPSVTPSATILPT